MLCQPGYGCITCFTCKFVDHVYTLPTLMFYVVRWVCYVFFFQSTHALTPAPLLLCFLYVSQNFWHLDGNIYTMYAGYVTHVRGGCRLSYYMFFSVVWQLPTSGIVDGPLLCQIRIVGIDWDKIRMTAVPVTDVTAHTLIGTCIASLIGNQPWPTRVTARVYPGTCIASLIGFSRLDYREFIIADKYKIKFRMINKTYFEVLKATHRYRWYIPY